MRNPKPVRPAMRTRMALLAMVAGLAACDSTVGLDVTRPTFTKLLAPGACKVVDQNVVPLSQLELSVMLLDGKSGILPENRLQQETRAVYDLLTDNLQASFRFARPADAQVDVAEPAFAEGEMSGTTQGVDLGLLDLNYNYTGGFLRRNDNLLVVLALDHSGSLIGQDPRTQMVDISRGSDTRDERITYFQQLVNDFPESAFLSVTRFNGSLAGEGVTQDCSPPTLNRDVIGTCLSQLSRGEDGFTPLADALDVALTRVIESNTDLNPVVVMFTDGTEEGDTSTKTLAQVQQRYVDQRLANGLEPVPVIILHLDQRANSPYPRGRSAELQDFACATGGEYIFIERAAQFTQEEASNLQTIVSNRVHGTWRLAVETTLARPQFPADNYFVSTELTVTLGGKSRSVALTRKREGSDFNDTRLWFKKQ